MNAVASAVACPPAASKKIARRRPDNKVRHNDVRMHTPFATFPTFHSILSFAFNFNFSRFLQPQSQINKCNNEKRRREQENEYIEQLGEFIHINKRDMNAPKPDKAAILNEVVKHVSRT